MMKDISVNPFDYTPKKNEQEQRDKALKKACEEFEAVLTYQVLRSMRRTIDKSDLFHGGQGEEIYQSFLDQELAKNMVGLGKDNLSNLLYQQLKRHDISSLDDNTDGGTLTDLNPLRWPLRATLSSRFGWRKDPITGKKTFHYGIDLAAKEGTPVMAAMAGRVLFAGYQEKYGNMVKLDHGHGIMTLYAHNQENLVKKGDWVKIGSPIARVGTTGRSTGPHLHFEVRRDGKIVDPLQFLKA